MPHSVFVKPDFIVLMHLVKQVLYLGHLLLFGEIYRQLIPEQFVNLLSTQHLVVVKGFHNPLLTFCIVESLSQSLFHLRISRLCNLL